MEIPLLFIRLEKNPENLSMKQLSFYIKRLVSQANCLIWFITLALLKESIHFLKVAALNFFRKRRRELSSFLLLIMPV